MYTAHVLSIHAHTLSRDDSPLDRNPGRTGCGSGLLIFSQSEWTRAWNTRVYSTDSSLSNWEMTHADWPNEVVGRTGRVSERRRFISGGPGARESALAASRWFWTITNGLSRELTTKIRKLALLLILPFEEVPTGWLETCRWNVSGVGRWTRRENILVLEARAWMKWSAYVKVSTEQNAANSFLVTTWLWCGLSVVGDRVSLHSSSSFAAQLPTILARDMVIVSRWIISDAPSRLQEQHQPQVQVVHPTDEPAQSGACLARACEYSASNGTNQREFVLSQKETLCRRRCRTLRVDTGMMRTLEANRPSPERALIARERSERNHARLSSLEKDMRRIQAQEAASDATTQSETETIPRRQRDLSRRSRSTATIVGVPQCDRRSSQWVEPLTTWSSRPSDSGELRYILPEVRELVGTPRRKNRDRRRNRCRNVHLDGKRTHVKKPDELRAFACCSDRQAPIVRQAWCPRVAKNLEKPPGLAAPLTRTLDETLGACSVVRDRAQIGGAKPACYGTVGDDVAPFLTRGQESSSV